MHDENAREGSDVDRALRTPQFENPTVASAWLRGWLPEPVQRDDAQQIKVTALSGLHDAACLVSAANAYAHDVVAAARENGASWREIADALGISRQAAHKRYRAG